MRHMTQFRAAWANTTVFSVDRKALKNHVQKLNRTEENPAYRNLASAGKSSSVKRNMFTVHWLKAKKNMRIKKYSE
jgi:hypothetical protein